MDLLYVAILIAFFALISALALGCAHLQKRRGGLRQRNAATGTAHTVFPGQEASR